MVDQEEKESNIYDIIRTHICACIFVKEEQSTPNYYHSTDPVGQSQCYSFWRKAVSSSGREGLIYYSIC